jgi:hypothetical protein
MHVGLVMNGRCITRERCSHRQFASRVISCRSPRVSLSVELYALKLYYRSFFAQNMQSLSACGRRRDHWICIGRTNLVCILVSTVAYVVALVANVSVLSSIALDQRLLGVERHSHGAWVVD